MFSTANSRITWKNYHVFLRHCNSMVKYRFSSCIQYYPQIIQGIIASRVFLLLLYAGIHPARSGLRGVYLQCSRIVSC